MLSKHLVLKLYNCEFVDKDVAGFGGYSSILWFKAKKIEYKKWVSIFMGFDKRKGVFDDG